MAAYKQIESYEKELNNIHNCGRGGTFYDK